MKTVIIICSFISFFRITHGQTINISDNDTNYVRIISDGHQFYKRLKTSLPSGNYKVFYGACCDTLWLSAEIRNHNYYGEYREYFTNGNLKTLYLYDDEGLQTGESQDFYLDGTKHKTGNWSSGLKNGKFIAWHKNGMKESESYYCADKLCSTVLRWTPSGEIAAIQSFNEEGKGEGIALSRHGKNLKYSTIRIFSNGELVSAIEIKLTRKQIMALRALSDSLKK